MKTTMHHYIGVASKSGMALVTSMDNTNHTVTWSTDVDKQPLDFSERIAKETVTFMLINGIVCAVVSSPVPISTCSIFAQEEKT